jgi:hypothetical protein
MDVKEGGQEQQNEQGPTRASLNGQVKVKTEEAYISTQAMDSKAVRVRQREEKAVIALETNL